MITLLPHNTAWQAAFELEKKQLLRLDTKNIIQVEHIGSTAIYGVYAKPVIDILIGVKCLSDNLFKMKLRKYRVVNFLTNIDFQDGLFLLYTTVFKIINLFYSMLSMKQAAAVPE